MTNRLGFAGPGSRWSDGEAVPAAPQRLMHACRRDTASDPLLSKAIDLGAHARRPRSRCNDYRACTAAEPVTITRIRRNHIAVYNRSARADLSRCSIG